MPHSCKPSIVLADFQQVLSQQCHLQACTLDGTTYDISNIVPYVMKHRKHPVTGEALALKDIVKLNFAKSSEGEYICPMLKKVFTDHTHIVAVRPSGNVFCWEVSQLLLLGGEKAPCAGSTVSFFCWIVSQLLGSILLTRHPLRSTGQRAATCSLLQGCAARDLRYMSRVWP